MKDVIQVTFTLRELTTLINHAQLAVALVQQSKETTPILILAAAADMRELGMDNWNALLKRIAEGLAGREGLDIVKLELNDDGSVVIS